MDPGNLWLGAWLAIDGHDSGTQGQAEFGTHDDVRGT
jgi:hypothetical protein